MLAALERAPFTIYRPNEQTVPFVFASPHSGRSYPRAFVAQSRLSFQVLRRSEDAFVAELFRPACAAGAPLIAAHFPRAYLDANRAPQELDPGMFEGALTVPVDAASTRVQAGLGVIPRVVREGAEIYRRKLPAAEAERRLAWLHRPYHAALDSLIRATQAKFGVAILIDCHSMPSAAAAPDIVLGDRYAVSSAPRLTQAVETVFERAGFSVARNAPYAGGYTTQLHGRPGRHCHALQIEINRALYLDEDAICPAAGYAELALRLSRCLSTLLVFDHGQLRPLRHAAE